MKTYEKSSELLRDAATLLNKAGKCVGAFHNDFEGSYCAIGALRKVAFDRLTRVDDDRHKNVAVYYRASDALAKLPGGIYKFSDNHDKATVVDMMRATADRLARKGD